MHDSHTRRAPRSASARIADFVADLALTRVPSEVQAVAKGALLDGIGVAVAGTQTEAAAIMVRWARETGGTPSAGIIGAGLKTSPATAARANGTIGHALDYDPPTPLLAVLVSLAEATGASGREALEAYVAAFEIQIRLQEGVSRKHFDRGWHSNAVFGTIGATLAAAKLFKLDPERIAMALGIAASEASGVRQNLGTLTKPHHAGHAAANGIVAASLARLGLTGAADGIEGEYGLLNVIAMPGEFDLDQITNALGRTWHLGSGTRLKPYPCCRFAHRSLDALLSLLRRFRFDAPQIERIECEVDSRVTRVMTYRDASTGLQAKFCLPYCLAVAVADGRATLRQFSDERVRDPVVQALARRVRVLPADESPGASSGLQPCVVRVRLMDGTVVEESAGPGRGDIGNPMSFDEIVVKYRSCVDELLGPADQDRLLALVSNLECESSFSELAEILTFKPVPACNMT